MIFERLHLEVMRATKINCSDDELTVIARAAISDLFGGKERERIDGVMVRERKDNMWTAGWWDERFSPSCASGDLGFTAETPEDAVRELLRYVLLDNNSREAR